MSVMVDVNPNGSAWREQVAQVAREWRSNARLRVGVWLIVATLWGWMLLLVQDQTKLWQQHALDAQTEFVRLRPLRAEGHWPQRADEAGRQLEAARSMLWVGGSRGLIEAALQDHLRDVAEKSGLVVRELNIQGEGLSKGGAPAVHAKLAVDGPRLSHMALLAELGRSPRLIQVQGLRLRPVGSPVHAELELRVHYHLEERKP